VTSQTSIRKENHYQNHHIHNLAKSRKTQMINCKLRTEEREQDIIATVELRERGK